MIPINLDHLWSCEMIASPTTMENIDWVESYNITISIFMLLIYILLTALKLIAHIA